MSTDRAADAQLQINTGLTALGQKLPSAGIAVKVSQGPQGNIISYEKAAN